MLSKRWLQSNKCLYGLHIYLVSGTVSNLHELIHRTLTTNPLPSAAVMRILQMWKLKQSGCRNLTMWSSKSVTLNPGGLLPGLPFQHYILTCGPCENSVSLIGEANFVFKGEI